MTVMSAVMVSTWAMLKQPSRYPRSEHGQVIDWPFFIVMTLTMVTVILALPLNDF